MVGSYKIHIRDYQHAILKQLSTNLKAPMTHLLDDILWHGIHGLNQEEMLENTAFKKYYVLRNVAKEKLIKAMKKEELDSLDQQETVS